MKSKHMATTCLILFLPHSGWLKNCLDGEFKRKSLSNTCILGGNVAQRMTLRKASARYMVWITENGAVISIDSECASTIFSPSCSCQPRGDWRRASQRDRPRWGSDGHFRLTVSWHAIISPVLSPPLPWFSVFAPGA